jgi:hypothetical protein
VILEVPVDTDRLYDDDDPHYVLFLAALVESVADARAEIHAEQERQAKATR